MSSSGKTVDTRVTGSCVWRLVSCSESFFFFFFSFSSFHSEQQHPSFVSFRFFNFQWHSVWPLLWGAWTDGKLFSNRFSFSFVPSSTDISAPLCSRITRPRRSLETSPPPPKKFGCATWFPSQGAFPFSFFPFFFFYSFSILSFLLWVSPLTSWVNLHFNLLHLFSLAWKSWSHGVFVSFFVWTNEVTNKTSFLIPHFLACHSQFR